MQLKASLNLKQKQSLVMTPQLQQAIRLLQMTNLDLRQYLETECFDNPFLEVGSAEDLGENSKKEEKNLSSADDSSNSSSKEIDSALKTGEAQSDDPAANSDYENRFDTEATDFIPKRNNTVQNDDYDYISSSVESNPISLQEHVYKQIDLNFTENEKRVVAHAFVES